MIFRFVRDGQVDVVVLSDPCRRMAPERKGIPEKVLAEHFEFSVSRPCCNLKSSMISLESLPG